jgi:hypothetical protein
MIAQEPMRDEAFGYLAERLHLDTEYLSGGFERTAAYQELLGFGEACLPYLYTGPTDISPAVIQLSDEIARQIGKPIIFQEDVKPLLTAIRWANKNGYSGLKPKSE